MVQIQYNFMDVENQAGSQGLELAGSKGIPVVIMEGLLGGRLAVAPDNVQALYDAYPVKRSPVEWAFRWLCNHPQVATVLSGCTSVEQVRDNLAHLRRGGAGRDERKRARPHGPRARGVPQPHQGRLHGCAYCMPCPQGVDIPGAFSAWNNASLYGGLEKGNADYKKLVEAGKSPKNCVECGACMAACPQHIEIIDMLKNVTADLD